VTVIRVLLADDHAMVRAGLKEILETTGDIVVVAEATNGHEALEKVRGGDCDVAVVDMSMPGRSGIELIRLIKSEKPKVRVLVLSMHSEEQYAVRAVKAGASGYLTKESAPDELVAAIRRVAAGGAFISPETAERLVLESSGPRDEAPHELLSDREYEVLRMLVSGQSLTEVATALNLSVKTISTHKTRLQQKIGVANQTELVKYALKHGILD
jgi:DNA-binding NarL/FixJ family response regulator